MKIKSIKFYQAVKFGKDSHTYFPGPGITNNSGPTLTGVEERENGLLIYNDASVTLASWNNIAYIEYDPASFQPKVQEPKKAK